MYTAGREVPESKGSEIRVSLGVRFTRLYDDDLAFDVTFNIILVLSEQRNGDNEMLNITKCQWDGLISAPSGIRTRGPRNL